MHILVAAFACEPGRGSEPGVGWEWVNALSETTDHQITVITQAANRSSIEAWLAKRPLLGVSFVYVELRNRLRRFGTPGHYVFYYVWQMKALAVLFMTGRWKAFDLVHHLTYGGIRAGSLLFFLPCRFMFGPVGGGETAPSRLVEPLGKSYVRLERLRKITSLFARVEPVLALMQLRATRVLAKTQQTADCLVFARKKVQVALEIGVPRVPVQPDPQPAGRPFRILFAARLIYWKGCDFLVDAARLLDQDGVATELVIVGDGERADAIRGKIAALETIQPRMTGRIPQSELFRHYAEADCFVLPSLHDSSGNVVLEAMTFGLPVVCFDLGGPPLIVGDAGLSVKVDDADYEEACQRLAQAIRTLRDDPHLREELSNSAIRRATQLTWQHAVKTGYGHLLFDGSSQDSERSPSLPISSDRQQAGKRC